MQDLLPDLCDHFEELVQVVEPMFGNYGGRETFGGEIVTIKAFEDNSLVREQVAQQGQGKVLVVDGGGSMRRAMLGDMLAEKAQANGWEGDIIYGCTGKLGFGQLNGPVTFGGVTFRPGEYVYADNNGVLVSPQKLELPQG